MKKVVYNNCYGGFSISKKCAEWMADRCHEEAIDLLRQDGDSSGSEFYGYWDGPRHDALLVMAVEALGSDEASGESSQLSVHELGGSKYYIREYDGSETVVEPEHIRWIEA